MKALAWRGNHDVRVETVPDPGIEQPTDAIIRVTSSGICGSDLHLYEVLGAFIEDLIIAAEDVGIHAVAARLESPETSVDTVQVDLAKPRGPDLDAHLEKTGEYEDAGFDELYVQQVGDGHERMFELYSQEILPRYNGS
jgi:hypothetical protein